MLCEVPSWANLCTAAVERKALLVFMPFVQNTWFSYYVKVLNGSFSLDLVLPSTRSKLTRKHPLLENRDFFCGVCSLLNHQALSCFPVQVGGKPRTDLHFVQAVTAESDYFLKMSLFLFFFMVSDYVAVVGMGTQVFLCLRFSSEATTLTAPTTQTSPHKPSTKHKTCGRRKNTTSNRKFVAGTGK